jgi:hypothetical protein
MRAMTKTKDRPERPSKKRESSRLSLHPLSFETALAAALKTGKPPSAERKAKAAKPRKRR